MVVIAARTGAKACAGPLPFVAIMTIYHRGGVGGGSEGQYVAENVIQKTKVGVHAVRKIFILLGRTEKLKEDAKQWFSLLMEVSKRDRLPPPNSLLESTSVSLARKLNRTRILRTINNRDQYHPRTSTVQVFGVLTFSSKTQIPQTTLQSG